MVPKAVALVSTVVPKGASYWCWLSHCVCGRLAVSFRSYADLIDLHLYVDELMTDVLDKLAGSLSEEQDYGPRPSFWQPD